MNTQTNGTPNPGTPPAEHMDPTTGEVIVGPVISDASLSLGKFVAALAAAQLEMENVTKDRVAQVESQRTGAKFTYGYADLAGVLEACRKPLAKNGIATMQRVRAKEQRVEVETILMHASGEWISSRLALTADDSSPQRLASVITYARRYSLMALVGLAASEDDDDGRAAQQAKRSAQPQKSEQKSEPKPPPAPLTDDEVNALLLEIKELKTPDAGATLKKKLGAMKPRMPDHVQKQLGEVLTTKLKDLNEAALKAAAEPPPKSTQAQGAAQP